jgi:hypothetical protein
MIIVSPRDSYAMYVESLQPLSEKWQTVLKLGLLRIKQPGRASRVSDIKVYNYDCWVMLDVVEIQTKSNWRRALRAALGLPKGRTVCKTKDCINPMAH